MEKDIKNITVKPILKWVYSSNDVNLENTVGSTMDNSPFPQPVSGDYHFTETPNLSGK
jgi:hypothetical protein